MRKSRILLAPSLAVAVLATAGPAFAEDPTLAPTDTPVVGTAPPAQPEESDLVEGAPETPAPAPSDATATVPDDVIVPAPKDSFTPDAQACEPRWIYYPTSKDKDYHKGVGAEQANYNGTSRTAKSTFVSEVSGTVGISYTGEFKVEGSAAVIKIEGKFGVNVSASLTARLGNTIAVDTPPRKTTFARYGVYRLKSYGYNQYTYTNCTKGAKKNVTIYTPHRIGWAIWEK
ncbi:hypothetical protein [Streptomyces muensis]|uniref:Uncharacterized protein n=1 Tax=Streptomyces muensis TaxID=1077944 RepID=A0A9X1PY77_STRM4|nr:hypothetical protein [Streptomyces muensis]MCF1595582.1 hypothetical protein [Streptomyces muensis]